MIAKLSRTTRVNVHAAFSPSGKQAFRLLHGYFHFCRGTRMVALLCRVEHVHA